MYNSGQLLGTSGSFDVAAGRYLANPITKIPAGGGVFGGGSLVSGGGACGEIGRQVGIGMEGVGLASLARVVNTPMKFCFKIRPGNGNRNRTSSCFRNR